MILRPPNRSLSVPPIPLLMLGIALSTSLAGCGSGAAEEAALTPIDPQVVQDQDDMTWEDYRPIPGRNWADPSLVPERGFRLAVVAIDFPDQPFVITLPKGSDPFGNPQIDPISREEVPRFYADFWMKPGQVNHGQTINGYWMEQSRGKFGITEVEAFGPYRMPKNRWEYGLNEYGQEESTPDGRSVEGNRMEPDCDSIWAEDVGIPAEELRDRYDAVLRVYASYDETGVWQEFGEMKFNTREDIPPEWGNPNPDEPRWIPTRYVEWTSWLAGAQQWGLSSMRQGENSGTITHEIGHYSFRLPDLNNNPYVEPYRRVAAGTWDMMDRGCFNGPGGPHMRWVVPPTHGAAMPAGLMVKNRLENGFIAEDDVLTLSREGLAKSGMAVARITARAVAPLPGTFAGVVVRLDGAEPRDRTPEDDPATNPLSSGIPNYDAYSLEVVQRLGYDSFTPDNGVLLAKFKDSLRGRNGGPNAFNSYIWVIDAHPEDIDQVDYVKPDGRPVMRTIADYRQLNDALFHAGMDSGSEFEWEDPHNRLHFYVVDLERNETGILVYTVAVRSLDGSGDRERGATLDGPTAARVEEMATPVTLTLTNSGSAPPANPGLHPDDATTFLQGDLYRIAAEVEGEGWSVRLLNALAAVEVGESHPVTVYLSADASAADSATLVLTATSESDPSATVRATVSLTR